MRHLYLVLALLFSLNTLAADYAREKRWADEILPAVLVGDPVWLDGPKGHRFLALYTPAAKARAAVVVVHGLGVHPDWGLISVLRQQLPEHGYSTLSVQMPVLAAEARGDAIRPPSPRPPSGSSGPWPGSRPRATRRWPSSRTAWAAA